MDASQITLSLLVILLVFSNIPKTLGEVDERVIAEDRFKCDACRALAYQFWSAFYEQKVTRMLPLDDGKVMKISTGVCQNRNIWEQYGVKFFKKENMLSGPGLRADEFRGDLQHNPKYHQRLITVCTKYTHRILPIEFLRAFESNPDRRESFEDYLCFDMTTKTSHRNACSYMREAKEKFKKRAKDEL